MDYHRANPHVSTEDYVRSKRIALGQEVAKRERVYLDKRYWILLRDVEIGRSTNGFIQNLLNHLRKRVTSGVSICPISESVFFELLKQEDYDTRKATASLIDELSAGITLIPFHERVSQELCHYFYSMGGVGVLYPIEQLVWSKLSYVLGVFHPSNTPFSAEDERMLQKAFFDDMWECSLSEMIGMLNNVQPPEANFEQLAELLNKANREHSEQIRSFRQVYLVEFRGTLSLFMPTARRVIENIAARASGQPFEYSEEEKEFYEKELLNYFAEAVRKNEVALALPTLHIGALCHAAIRWDKKRKLMGNDIYDLHHAEAALAYCSVFLTEKPLKKMLEQNHLGIHRDFQCRIISSEEEALAWASGHDG